MPPSVSGLAANLAQLPARPGPQRCRAGEPPELGQIPLGVALADVDGQVGDPLSVPSVLTQRAGPQGAAGAGDGFVDRVFHDRADATGQQLSGTGPVERIGVDLGCRGGQHRVAGGKRGVHGAEVRQRVCVGRFASGAAI